MRGSGVAAELASFEGCRLAAPTGLVAWELRINGRLPTVPAVLTGFVAGCSVGKSASPKASKAAGCLSAGRTNCVVEIGAALVFSNGAGGAKALGASSGTSNDGGACEPFGSGKI
jgi:hypothetical protein